MHDFCQMQKLEPPRQLSPYSNHEHLNSRWQIGAIFNFFETLNAPFCSKKFPFLLLFSPVSWIQQKLPFGWKFLGSLEVTRYRKVVSQLLRLTRSWYRPYMHCCKICMKSLIARFIIKYLKRTTNNLTGTSKDLRGSERTSENLIDPK